MIEPPLMNRRRELILQEGSRLIEDRGFRGVSIQDITESAGLSVGSFYNYFQSKEELYLTIIKNLETDGMKRAERIVSRYRSPVNQIRALYRFVTLGVRRNRILRGVLTAEKEYMCAGVRDHLEGSDHIRKRVESIIGDILREGTLTNVFRTGLYRDAKFLVTALFDTILSNLESDSLEDLVEDLLALIERGLKRRLRLRRRNERLDRRMLRGTDDDEFDTLDL